MSFLIAPPPAAGITWKKILTTIPLYLTEFLPNDPFSVLHVWNHIADLSPVFTYKTGWNVALPYNAFDVVHYFGGALFACTNPNLGDPPTSGSGNWEEIALFVDQWSTLEYAIFGDVMFLHFDLCLEYTNPAIVGSCTGVYITLPEGKLVNGRAHGQGQFNCFPAAAPLHLSIQDREAFIDKVLLMTENYNLYNNALLMSDAFPGQFQPWRLVVDIVVPIK